MCVCCVVCARSICAYYLTFKTHDSLQLSRLGQGPCQEPLPWKQGLKTADLLSVSSSNVWRGFIQRSVFRSACLTLLGFFKFTHRVFIHANLLTPPAPIELATRSKGPAWPWTSDWICLCRFSAQFCFIYGAAAAAQPPSGGWVEARGVWLDVSRPRLQDVEQRVSWQQPITPALAFACLIRPLSAPLQPSRFSQKRRRGQ